MKKTFTKEQLISSILAVGLFENVYPESREFSSAVTGRGMWQMPDELAGLMVSLQDKQITSYLNIGTFNGVTFSFVAAFLSYLNDCRCVTVDPHPRNDIITDSRFSYVTGTSDQFKDQRFDFVFIDGDHTSHWVARDYDNVGQHARYCAFHDIQSAKTDVPSYWNKIKETKKHVEFIGEKANVFGIGLLIQE